MTADPFTAIPDADPSTLELRRPWIEKDNTCELVGKPKRKKVDFSPMQRRWFEQQGYTLVARVEKPNPWGAVNVDLWGFADWIAARPGEILLVQTTDITNASTRERKARATEELWRWLEAGGKFQVHAWKQPGGAGTRWEVSIVEVERDSERTTTTRKAARVAAAEARFQERLRARAMRAAWRWEKRGKVHHGEWECDGFSAVANVEPSKAEPGFWACSACVRLGGAVIGQPFDLRKTPMAGRFYIEMRVLELVAEMPAEAT